MIVTTGPPRDGSSPRSRKSTIKTQRDRSMRSAAVNDEEPVATKTPQKSNHSRTRSRIHSTYLERMSEYKDKELEPDSKDQ